MAILWTTVAILGAVCSAILVGKCWRAILTGSLAKLTTCAVGPTEAAMTLGLWTSIG